MFASPQAWRAADCRCVLAATGTGLKAGSLRDSTPEFFTAKQALNLLAGSVHGVAALSLFGHWLILRIVLEELLVPGGHLHMWPSCYREWQSRQRALPRPGRLCGKAGAWWEWDVRSTAGNGCHEHHTLILWPLKQQKNIYFKIWKKKKNPKLNT